MSIQAIAASIKSSVTEALNAVQLPEGVDVSAEVKQQLADAGVRGTLNALDAHEGTFITYEINAGTPESDLIVAEHGQLVEAYFADINS
jgi:hypothetical protein